MASELIYFHKGLEFSRRSCLQEPGTLKTAENISFEVEAVQKLRSPFSALNSSAIGAVHSLKTFRTLVVAGDGSHIRANAGSGDFTDLYGSFANSIWTLREYKDFLSGVNGTDFILVDASKNVYPARVTNPAAAPTLTASATGGNPNGNYMGYVSFLITFPNGHTYETGLSPVSANVNPASKKIDWTNIPVATYAAYYGTAPTIHRKLYRGPGNAGTLTAVYYLDTIADNTTTTYTDNTSDATLQVSDISYVDIYGPPPVSRYIAWHYGRAFMIEEDHRYRLWWSEAVGDLSAAANEAIFPIATIDTSYDDLRVAGFEQVDPQGIVPWGINLYIPLKQTWIRKQGNDPTSWSYKKTYANHGIGAPYTIDTSTQPGGIIGVTNPEAGEPGLALFDGQSTSIFSSPKLDYIFNTDMNLDQIAKCRGKVSGHYYHLLYPSGSATEPDTHLAIDMRRYPDIRVAEWTDLHGQSIDDDSQGKNFYLGGSDGYVRKRDTSGTVSALIETKDLVGDPKAGGSPVSVKTWNQLKYALNGTVTLEFYIDDVIQKWPDGTTSKIITGISEALQVIPSFPQNWQGYRMMLRITGTGLQTLEIYSPWLLEYELT
jgi:hypothetical protein